MSMRAASERYATANRAAPTRAVKRPWLGRTAGDGRRRGSVGEKLMGGQFDRRLEQGFRLGLVDIDSDRARRRHDEARIDQDQRRQHSENPQHRDDDEAVRPILCRGRGPAHGYSGSPDGGATAGAAFAAEQVAALLVPAQDAAALTCTGVTVEAAISRPVAASRTEMRIKLGNTGALRQIGFQIRSGPA